MNILWVALTLDLECIETQNSLPSAINDILSTETIPQLFQTADEILDLELTANFQQLFQPDSQEKVFGTLLYDDPKTGEQTLTVRLRPRGHLRRESNSIKPLDINIVDSVSDTTLFANIRSVDLVPHRQGERSEVADSINQKIIKEFYYYRLSQMLNLSPLLVKLVRVHYKNEDGTTQGIGFAILRESKKTLARRMHWSRLNRDKVTLAQLKRLDRARIELFESLIQNGDYDFRSLDNLLPFQSGAQTIILPYDFDLARSIEEHSVFRPLSPELQMQTQMQLVGRDALRSLVSWQIHKFEHAAALVDALPFTPESKQELLAELAAYENAAQSVLSLTVPETTNYAGGDSQ